MGIFGIFMAGGFMAGLGIALAGVLAVANKKLFVYEDPRIDELEELLPKTNCGACGCAGCRAFSEKLVAGQATPAQCTVSSPDQVKTIALYLGVNAGSIDKKVARLACAGGRHVAYLRAKYSGYDSCRAAAVVSGGGKECAWGCLGLADCANVCDFGAITMDIHSLPVVDANKCTACNDCVEICPKGLFSLQPIVNKLWVACKNQADGETAEKACEVACTGCGRCAADAKPNVIQIVNNLAVINYDFNADAERSATERCPTGAIVWWETPNSSKKGTSAKKILRNGELPVLK